jgi:phosphatidylethanolamine-binding protein (PEBP) family uncharacterized protein
VIEACASTWRFGGNEVREAVKRHVLAQASITGRYTLNPAVKI